MTTRGFAIFETAVGACGIAWSDAGVTNLLLPDATVDALYGFLKD